MENAHLCWQRHAEIGTLVPYLWDCKMIQSVWKKFAASQKVKKRIVIWPSKSTPRYIPKRTEEDTKTNTLQKCL